MTKMMVVVSRWWYEGGAAAAVGGFGVDEMINNGVCSVVGDDDWRAATVVGVVWMVQPGEGGGGGGNGTVGATELVSMNIGVGSGGGRWWTGKEMMREMGGGFEEI
ncbi:hypothetical protein Tco_0255436 [Tanacetum coccineum]